MEMNLEKTKCMVAAKEQQRCKQEIRGKVVEQVMEFTYLGPELTKATVISSRKLETNHDNAAETRPGTELTKQMMTIARNESNKNHIWQNAK